MEQQNVAVREADGDVLAAVLVLNDPAPAPALVGEERYGWRTASSRRHPIPTDLSARLSSWPGHRW
ncbi:hypothetical protein ACIOUE_38600 [Streptomyces xanthochromogenes]|uniref:hypothetical protein n=1 Tax=Streptomyces xanthochromogenes TaxID=67384 RepID=UPI0038267B2D